MLSSSSSSPKCILDHALLTIDKALIALLDHCCGVDRAKHIYLDVNYDSLHLSSSSLSSSSGVNALIQQSLQTIHSDISSAAAVTVVAANASSILDNSNPSIHCIDIGIDSTQLQQLQSIVWRMAKDFSSYEQSNESSVVMPVEYVDDVRSSSSSSNIATTTTLYDYIKSRFVDDCDNDRVMERHIRLRFLSSLLLLISCGWTFQIARRQRVRMSEGGSILLPDASTEEKKNETDRHDVVVRHGVHHDNNAEPSRDTDDDDDDVTILSLHCSLCGRSVCYDVNAVKCSSSSTTSTTTTTTTSGVGSNNHSQMMPWQQQPFDPIHQHRYFCPWINSQSIVPTWFDVLTIITAPDDRDGNRADDSSSDNKRGADGDEEVCIENKIKGFEYYMCALNQFRSPAYLHAHVSSKHTVINQSSPSVASSVVVTAETVVDESSLAAAAVVIAPTVAISTTTTSTTARDISPEQAYKRIRLILETASVK